MSSRIVARPLELEEHIALLSQEHQEQRKRLSELADVLEKKDYARGAELVKEFDNSSVQHIVDEENVLLNLVAVPISFHESDRFSWLHTLFCHNLRSTFVP